MVRVVLDGVQGLQGQGGHRRTLGVDEKAFPLLNLRAPVPGKIPGRENRIGRPRCRARIKDEKPCILRVGDPAQVQGERNPALGRDAEKGQGLERFAQSEEHVHPSLAEAARDCIVLSPGGVGDRGKAGRGSVGLGRGFLGEVALGAHGAHHGDAVIVGAVRGRQVLEGCCPDQAGVDLGSLGLVHEAAGGAVEVVALDRDLCRRFPGELDDAAGPGLGCKARRAWRDSGIQGDDHLAARCAPSRPVLCLGRDMIRALRKGDRDAESPCLGHRRRPSGIVAFKQDDNFRIFLARSGHRDGGLVGHRAACGRRDRGRQRPGESYGDGDVESLGVAQGVISRDGQSVIPVLHTVNVPREVVIGRAVVVCGKELTVHAKLHPAHTRGIGCVEGDGGHPGENVSV